MLRNSWKLDCSLVFVLTLLSCQNGSTHDLSHPLLYIRIMHSYLQVYAQWTNQICNALESCLAMLLHPRNFQSLTDPSHRGLRLSSNMRIILSLVSSVNISQHNTQCCLPDRPKASSKISFSNIARATLLTDTLIQPKRHIQAIPAWYNWGWCSMSLSTSRNWKEGRPENMRCPTRYLSLLPLLFIWLTSWSQRHG